MSRHTHSESKAKPQRQAESAAQPAQARKPTGSHVGVRTLQRKAGNRAVSGALHPGDAAPLIVHEALRAPGRALDPETRAFMEPRFGQDFGAVRVHTDACAADSAQALDAQAYTTGQDIVFSPGAYNPDTQPGRVLLSHELTHVIQQSKSSRITQGELFSRPGDPSEQEAVQISQQANWEMPSQFSIYHAAPAGQIQGDWGKKAHNAWKKIKKAVGAEPDDEEKLLKELQEGIERSQKLCEGASILISDPQAAERLKIAGEKFEGASKYIGKGLKVREAARDIAKLIDAIETLDGLDIRKEPEEAAKAFGKLFASVGNLGQLLGEGPLAEYFKFLAGMEDFFTNVRRGFRPSGSQQLKEIGIGEEGESL